MKKKFGCKSLALLLTVIMVLSVFAPVVAAAAELDHADHDHKEEDPDQAEDHAPACLGGESVSATLGNKGEDHGENARDEIQGEQAATAAGDNHR